MNEIKVAKLAAGVSAAMEQLIDILERENQALSERDHAAIAAMVREKAAAARGYESKMKALGAATGELGDLDGQYTETLERLGEILEPLADENTRLLKVAMEANRRLLAAVSEAVCALAPATAGYTQRGGAGEKDGARTAAPVVPINFDHSL